jgi:hypothetical protein
MTHIISLTRVVYASVGFDSIQHVIITFDILVAVTITISHPVELELIDAFIF